MIRAYPLHSSVLPGGTLTLCVSSPSARFRVELFRQGATLEKVGEAAFSSGAPMPSGAPDRDWGWPRHELPVPADWASGVYLARLFAEEAAGAASAPPVGTPGLPTPSSEALFVVRSAAPGRHASILYKLPLFTWHAYNETSPGASLYTGGRKVTLRRPGGGAGGVPWDADVPDVYDLRSPRQVFAHWDAPFIAWLEQNGYAVDYCTDLDVDRDPEALRPYALMLSVGHDEYWSPGLREHVERHVQGGGNVAFFSANTCWWRVHLDDDGSAFSCDKSAPEAPGGAPSPRPPARDMWYATRSEASLTGVSYRHGGGFWDGERPALGFTVLAPDHWVFDGTGLGRGEEFGAGDALVGYECDGCALEGERGSLDVRPTGEGGTPAGFEILALAWLGEGWQDLKADGPSAATLGIYTRGGTVFTAATVDWPRVVAAGTNREVERITRNVLDRLGARAPGRAA